MTNIYERNLTTGQANSIPAALSRADLHVHSTASQLSKLGVQRQVGMPECATPPEEVYRLAKERGMDFVAITDHDTIDGALQIASKPDVIIGEELTTWFKGEPQAVHVLCLGITPDDHEWLQAHRNDVVRCAEYLHENEITCSLAHPFFAPEAPLTARHRRELSVLFPVWETRNGARARDLNAPAATFIETSGGTGTGGSDDHAGVDIGRTYTETPLAYNAQEFLAHIRAGRAVARGAQGSAEKWAHAAIAIALRSLGREDPASPRTFDNAQPPAASKLAAVVSRVMSEGDTRRGEEDTQDQALSSDDARALLRSWLESVGMRHRSDRQVIEYLQAENFDHSALRRRAQATHERRLATATDAIVKLAAAEPHEVMAKFQEHLDQLLGSLIPVLPYLPAAAFLSRERRKLHNRLDSEPWRVALIAEGIGSMHGVTHAINTIRERGVPGFQVDVIGSDGNVDVRVPAVAELPVPFYESIELGVPQIPAFVQAVAEGRYDVIHVTSPGPMGWLAIALAKLLELPLVASYHTELASYAGIRSGQEMFSAVANAAVAKFYEQGDVVLSPSPQTDGSLCGLGIHVDKLARWDRGVDTKRFRPGLRDKRFFEATSGIPSKRGQINVLYAGRLTKEKGVELLAESFKIAHSRNPRLQLVVAGGGPESEYLVEQLGENVTLLGWLSGNQLATAYASADVFLFASQTDTFGQVLLEAAASGLPAVAVAEGGPCSIIAHGETGMLCPADASLLAEAVEGITSNEILHATLSRNAVAAAATKSWGAALAKLGAGYAQALSAGTLNAAQRDARSEQAWREAMPSAQVKARNSSAA